MSEQELINYLYWLKERGQVHIDWTVPASAEPRPDTPLKETPASSLPIPTVIKLLFISQEPLTLEEREMVSRIASALGLETSDFQIVTQSETKAFAPYFSIALGHTDSPHALSLTIPHPGDMLREPKLKVSAWQDLKKFKAQIN